MQQTALSTAVTHALAMPSQREIDANGYHRVRDNPLSKVGVFEYLGSELPGLDPPADPSRIYRVYRSAATLGDPECLQSFSLVPLIDDHTWIGPGGMAPEQKGTHGVTGEAPFFDGEYLRSTLKIFSRALADKIAAGKRELSAGYSCVYDWATGVFNGQAYDIEQRHMRGNHIALVDFGRMGPDVAVLDRLPISFDTLEFVKMADTSPTIEELSAQIAELMPVVEQVNAMQAQLAAATTPAESEAVAAEAEETAGEVIEAASEVEEAAAAVEGAEEGEAEEEMAALDEKEKALDAAARKLKKHAKSLDAALRVGEAKARAADARGNRRVKSLDAKIKRIESATGDSAVVAIAKRDTLARSLYPVIGVFDHGPLTHAEVVAYGASKLGLPEGTAADTLETFIKGRQSVSTIARVADTAATGALADYRKTHQER